MTHLIVRLNAVSEGRNQPPRPTQPGHPSTSRQNENWRCSRPPLEKKQRVLSKMPWIRTAGILS